MMALSIQILVSLLFCVKKHQMIFGIAKLFKKIFVCYLFFDMG